MVFPAAIPITPRMLSVQSHVVSGYCGNKSATFPLQLLEFEVDVVNTVQLSNHTQYKVTKGQIFGSKDLEALHIGLKENQLLKLYDGILSGYVADVDYIESMAKLIADTKEVRQANNKNCFYTLDPVLGDDGVGYYVPGGVKIAEAYKKHLIPLADIITPNRFEASVLSGVEIDTKSDNALDLAIEAVNVLHKQMGVKIVVITSLNIEKAKDRLICLVSKKLANGGENSNANPTVKKASGQEGCNELDSGIWTISIPKLSLPFTGTGDLFTALLTGWLHKTNFDIKQSLQNTVNSIHDILEDTLAWYLQAGDKSVQSFELRLVQNRDKIIEPSDKLKAQLFEFNNNGETGSLSFSLSQDKLQASNNCESNEVAGGDKI